ncbi:MAG: META domain-containing protein [Bacteroidales bacterium]|jgi:heat shock protein HslJ|nr:META domain-containing protein [Bacteroidales bacterium]
MKRIFILAMSAMLMISVGCSKKIVDNNGGNVNNQESKSLYETSWILTKINAKKVQRDEDKKQVTLIIDEESKNVSGYAACNRYFGKVEIKKDQMTFSQIATTKRMCPPTYMQIEDDFLKNLNRVDNYLIQESKLYLRKGENILLTFSAQ